MSGVCSETVRRLWQIVRELREVPKRGGSSVGLGSPPPRPSYSERMRVGDAAGRLFVEAVELGAFAGPEHAKLREAIETARRLASPEKRHARIWSKAIVYLCPESAKPGRYVSDLWAGMCEPIANMIGLEAHKLDPRPPVPFIEVMGPPEPTQGDTSAGAKTEQGEGDAGAGAGETVAANGEVTNPNDPTAYIAASEARLKHAPAGLVVTHKELLAVLADHPEIRRWHPRANRLFIHLADWVAFVSREIEKQDMDGLSVSPDEVEARTAAVRQRKHGGK